ncbi:MAG: murein biosynthesis integral membrane protein MurJ [Candidatus Bipolaricaulia bacterium]
MRRFARDIVIIAGATAVSRVFGLFRDIVIADKFGAGTAYDAYLIAFYVPHFLRRLLAEGALALSFIPVYTDYLKNDPREASKLAANAINLSLLTFPLIVLGGILLAPYFVPFLASGFSPSQQKLTIELTRVIFPFIGIIGMAALVMGVLKSRKTFFAPAFAPVFFNVGVIAGALFLGRFFSRPIFGLAVGVLLGGMGQLGFQLPYLNRSGFSWSPVLFPLHPGLKRALKMMVPVVLGLIAMQVNVMVDNKLASHLVAGSVSSLQYATRLYQLPLGLFAIAISTAILPRLSEKWASGEKSDYAEMLNRGIKISLLIVVPATLGLFVLGKPIIELLFEHRNFLPSDTVRTTHVLHLYLVGLIGYSFVTLFSRAFYSMKDTITPVIVSSIAVGVNVGLDLLLIGPMKVGGLALATGVSGVVNGLLLVVAFGIRTGLRGYLPGSLFLVRVLVSAGIMGIVVSIVRKFIPLASDFSVVTLGVIAGIASYVCAGILLGLKETFLEELVQMGD